MSESHGAFWSGKWVYPVVAAVLLVAILAAGRCPRIQPVAMDFSLPVIADTGGAGPDRMSLADQRGKVVLLDFWATWCGPCRFTTPMLVRLHHRYRDRGLMVMGINVDQEGPGAVRPFMARYNVDYPMLYDQEGSASEKYNISRLPTLILVDRKGKVQLVHTGLMNEQELAETIERLL